jgi:UDP-glucose 4-epimerase
VKILITGGSGFIGSHIVDKLIDRGLTVRIMDVKKPYRNDVEFIKGDITLNDDIDKSLKNIDIIYHLAAFSNVDLVKSDPLKTVEVNVLGTTKLLKAAVRHKVKRFIFASSVFVYENKGHIYTTAKLASEMLCEDFYGLFGLPYTILRFSTAYGPRSRQVDVISLFVKKALNKEDLIIRGDGLQRRNFIYVDDLAQGCVMALEKRAKNKIYNIVHPVSISIKELAQLIGNLFKNEINIIYQDSREDDYYGGMPQKDKYLDELGWKPKVCLEEGIKRTIEWYKSTL